MKFFKKMMSMALVSVILLLSSMLPAMPAAAISDSEITSPAALLMDATTGQVLFEKNPHEVRACASVTKVMTLLLVFEALDSGKISLEDTVTTSARAASMGGSDIWLEEGETMSVDDMVKATVVASANDAAVALAEFVAGTEEDFIERMNSRAKDLGMADSVFKNCNGLDEEGHVTSAYDVAVMSRELIKHEKIYDYSQIWMDELRDGATQIVNTNKLLKSYTGITGLKTGTTSQAGSCITATATRDGMTLISVILGSSTGTERFKDAATMLDYGFANFTSITPEVPKEEIIPVKVAGGMQDEVGVEVVLEGGILTTKEKAAEVESKVVLKEEVEAPIKKGDKMGEVIYTVGDEELLRYEIIASADVSAISFAEVFKLLFMKFIQV